MAGDVWALCGCFRKRQNSVEEYEFEETINETRIEAQTGNPRNKVALSPGHSLMDWIRLGNSGADLTGVGGKLQRVTEDELAKHHLPDNAWLVIRGNVYNVTRYQNFHPGGVEELMKGAGKDATSLFTEVHPWVNYESILQKCLVGRLVKNKSTTQEDLAAAFFDALAPPSLSSGMKMCWSQTTQTISLRFNTEVSSPHILVCRDSDRIVRIYLRVRKKINGFGFKSVASLEWPCRLAISSETGKVEVQFSKAEEACWEKYGDDLKVGNNDELDAYHRARITSVHPVTHNTVLITCKFENASFWVPIGHDVRIRTIVEQMDIARRYTPCFPPCASAPAMTPDILTFLIKHYETGALTPHLFNKHAGDFIEIGGLDGDFDVRDLKGIEHLYLIAAGTGITPMTRLISWSFLSGNNVSTIKLLFINRREEDIIWRKELDLLAKDKPKFSVQYGLSQPSENWCGLKGRLDESMLASFLPSDVGNTDYICACGPKDFTLMIKEKLCVWGWSSRSHCFLG